LSSQGSDDEPPQDGAAKPAARGQARRQAFLDAARKVFLENGYEAASVNDVVAVAGGSLATLYGQFRNKEGLFLAVCQQQHDRFIEDMLPARNDALPLEEGLQAIGEQFLSALIAPDALAFYRIMLGGAHTHPQLFQRYVVEGGARVIAVVGGYLSARALAENRALADPDMAASWYVGLLRSRHHYAALADPQHVLDADQLRAHVRAAVQLFMHGAFDREPR
jgi:AcrR family transcriptional regulator